MKTLLMIVSLMFVASAYAGPEGYPQPQQRVYRGEVVPECDYGNYSYGTPAQIYVYPFFGYPYFYGYPYYYPLYTRGYSQGYYYRYNRFNHRYNNVHYHPHHWGGHGGHR